MRAAAGALAVAATMGGTCGRRHRRSRDVAAAPARRDRPRRARCRPRRGCRRWSWAPPHRVPRLLGHGRSQRAVTALVDTGVGRVCLVVGLGSRRLAATVDPPDPAVRRDDAVRPSVVALLGAAWGALLARPMASPAGAPAMLRPHWRPIAHPPRGAPSVVDATPPSRRAHAASPGDHAGVVAACRVGRSVDASVGRVTTTPRWHVSFRSSLDLLGCRGRGRLHALPRGRGRGAVGRPPSIATALASVRAQLRARAASSTPRSTTPRAATPLLRPLADALLASDRLGAPVGPVLARLADEERTALRRRAEAHARSDPGAAPVPARVPGAARVRVAHGGARARRRARAA